MILVSLYWTEIEGLRKYIGQNTLDEKQFSTKIMHWTFFCCTSATETCSKFHMDIKV